MRNLLGGAIFLSCLLITTSVAEAASLYFSPNKTEIRPRDTITVAVRLDTDEGECVNVVNGVINYDPNVQPVDISRGNSILPIWAEDPVIDKVNNRITFAGGIPNGYCGRIAGDPRLTNTLLEIIFQAPGFRIGIGDENPTSTIKFSSETSVLLNDGFGTQAPLNTGEAKIFVHKKPGNNVIDEWNNLVAADKSLPEEFSIALLKDPSIFDGKFFITFNTTDKQTGIDHYEVIEESLEKSGFFGWGAADAPWRVARSPYLLRDQTLNSVIKVKALDKAGNEYIATFIPEESQRKISNQQRALYGLAIASGILFMVVIGAVFFYQRKKKSYQYDDSVEDEIVD